MCYICSTRIHHRFHHRFKIVINLFYLSSCRTKSTANFLKTHKFWTWVIRFQTNYTKVLNRKKKKKVMYNMHYLFISKHVSLARVNTFPLNTFMSKHVSLALVFVLKILYYLRKGQLPLINTFPYILLIIKMQRSSLQHNEKAIWNRNKFQCFL